MKERYYIALLNALWALPCHAQEDALAHPVVAVVAKPTSIAASRAIGECPRSAGGDRDQLDVAIPADSVTVTCRVESARELGRADDADWRAVKYLTRYVFPADSIKRRVERGAVSDTAEVIDVVLYSVARGGTDWRGEWHVWADRRLTRDVNVRLGLHGGRAVFSVLSCVNGTGGCEQHFVARAKGRWSGLNERYYEQLAHRFGNAFWKGISVDVRTLRGVVPLYATGDANCCASGRLRLQLVVRDTEIVLGGASLLSPLSDSGRRVPDSHSRHR